MDGEIFIIDEEVIEYFFDEHQEYITELFFNYLSSWCECKKAYMIPSLYKKIIDWMKENSKTLDTYTQTKVIADFKNWVEEADLLGEDNGNDDKHDTRLLINLLKLLYPNKKIVIVSGKYKEDTEINSIDINQLFEYLGSKKDFMNFFEKQYNIGSWDSTY
ncbi:MAG: hypothetical protein WC511_04720 [Candidatus Pacearchaeota archaeon]|jgi:hypothetical protein